jgi:hypothetical protein
MGYGALSFFACAVLLLLCAVSIHNGTCALQVSIIIIIIINEKKNKSGQIKDRELILDITKTQS